MEAMWLDSRVLSFCLYTACTLRHLNTLQAFSRAPNKEVFTSAFAEGTSTWSRVGKPPQKQKRHIEEKACEDNTTACG